MRARLPLKNLIVDGSFSLPWHRALDESIGDGKELSIRYGNYDEEFLHVPNNWKGDPNFIGVVIGAKEWPTVQVGKVDLAGTEKDWSKKSDMTFAVFSRGRNVSPTKTKRLIDSLKSQSDQRFQLAYYDDASDAVDSEYLHMLMDYDPWCRSHAIFVENICQVGSLANFDRAIHNVITDPNEIIANVDGDDALCDSKAVRTIKSEFRDGADVTIGNVMRTDKPLQTYSVVGFKRSWERDGDNIWTHPKCFLRKLAGNIGGFLKRDGEYIDVHTDYAMMLPIMEAAECPRLIKEQIYLFDPSSENKTADKQYESKHRAETKKWPLDEARRVFMKPIAAVIGDARVSPDSETYKMAEAVGKALADMGYRVQTGGLGGVMEAAMKGAKESEKYEKDGTIAILPGNNEDDANQYADVRIATGEDLMRARKAVDANVVIAIGGGSWTLAEIATAWSTFKLLLAWTGGGWSGKLAGSKIDDRVRYPDIPEDSAYGFECVDDLKKILSKYGGRYTRVYHGITKSGRNG